MNTNSNRFFLFIFCLAGGLLLCFSTHPLGIGISQDSVNYMAAAKSFAESGVLRNTDGTYFTQWTPLYPLILFLLGKIPLPVEISVFRFNLLVYLLFIYSSVYLCSQTIQQNRLRIAAMITVVFSFTVLQVYSTAWSEGLFLLLVNLAILFLVKAVKTNEPVDFFKLSLVVAALCLQRYSGVFVAVAVVMFLFVYEREKPFVKRAGKASFYLIVFLFPLLLWMARNHFLTGELTGTRFSGIPFYVKNSTVMLETVTSWFFPIKLPLWFRLSLIVALMLLLFKKAGLFNLFQQASIIIVITYFVLMNWMYLLTSFEEPRDRMLSPVFFPFLLVVFSMLDQMFIRIQVTKGKIFSLGLQALIVVWLCYPVARGIKHVMLWHKEGVDIYNHAFWKDSETIKWMKENPVEKKLFSNDPYAVYYFTGMNCFAVPKKHLCCEPMDKKTDDKNYLIWFKNPKFYYLYDIPPVKKRFKVEEIQKLKDGTVYEMKPR